MRETLDIYHDHSREVVLSGSTCVDDGSPRSEALKAPHPQSGNILKQPMTLGTQRCACQDHIAERVHKSWLAGSHGAVLY